MIQLKLLNKEQYHTYDLNNNNNNNNNNNDINNNSSSFNKILKVHWCLNKRWRKFVNYLTIFSQYPFLFIIVNTTSYIFLFIFFYAFPYS